jgi:hypothetical protein
MLDAHLGNHLFRHDGTRDPALDQGHFVELGPGYAQRHTHCNEENCQWCASVVPEHCGVSFLQWRTPAGRF